MSLQATILDGKAVLRETNDSGLSYDCEYDILTPFCVWEGSRVSGNLTGQNYFQITHILESPPVRLAGTLILFTKRRYGVNSKRVPYYQFIPFDKKYPSCKVASSYAIKYGDSKNIYVLVELKTATVGVDMAQGEMVTVFGPIDDYEAACNAILYKCIQPFRKKKLLENTDTIVRCSDSQKTFFGKVYTIDPEGCQDIDDAISFEVLSEKEYRIGIHITDLVFLLEQPGLSHLKEYYLSQPFTIYSPQKVYHSLPEELSCAEGSLVADGFPRKTISLFLTIDIDSCSIKTTEIVNSILSITENLSYQQADKLIQRNSEWTQFHRMIEQLIEKDSIPVQSSEPSHRVIDYLMVFMNKWVANRLVQIENIAIPLRVHNGIYTCSSESADCSPLKDYLNRTRDNRSAYYQIYSPDEYHRHSGLNADFYLHFTSPLRRYSDYLSHCLVHYYLFGGNTSISSLQPIGKMEMTNTLNHINQFEKKNRKMERLWNWTSTLYTIVEPITEKARVIGWKIGDKLKIELFFPTYRSVFKATLLHSKTIRHFDVFTENDSLCIEGDSDSIEIELFSEIQVKLWWDYTKGFEGTRIEFVEPRIDFMTICDEDR